MDLNCTVAVIEQVVQGEKLIWERFGRAVAVINGLVTAVAWNANGQRAEFSRQPFDQVCTEFKRLTEHEWA